MTPIRTRKLLRTAAALAAIGVLASVASTGAPASADPPAFNNANFVGVGSDTTQDVVNCFGGNPASANCTPLAASNLQINSFDATPVGTCVITKVGGPSWDRPNGSSAGRRALSRSIDGAVFGSGACGPAKAIGGQVQFARSSSGPAAGDTGTALAYVPFGRDGVSFAYYRTDGSPVVSLTRAQLTTLFSTGATVIDGVRILPCGIQTSSGTHSFWLGAAGVTADQEAAATAECNGLVGGRAQENDGVDLKARGDAADAANNGTQVVIGFSAAAFISKSNGLATPIPPTGVGIGAISDPALGSPVTGTAPNLAPSATFFNNTTFGRNVYNVLPNSVINSAVGNGPIKAMFRGPTSAVCSATATIQRYGFLPHPNCGDTTTTRGSLLAGPAAV
jgi:ABC-type phosphate transport system substrate-binding protein